MILMYAFAAWLGGILTAATLWEPAGPLLAIALAPFGGSALVFCAALWIFLHQAPGRTDRVRSIGVGRHWWRLVR
jgi:hypothetical protein